MFFEFIGAKSCLGIFLYFLEPSRYFSDIKNNFSLFLKMIFNFKNMIITKNKRSSNPSNIYIYRWNPLRRALFKIRNPTHIRSETPEIARRSSEVVPTPAKTPASSYFRSVCRRRNPRVPLRSSRRELRPGAFNSSIRPTVHPQSTNLCSTPVRVVFSVEPPPLLYLGFLCFPVHTGPPSPFPHLPGGGAPSPQLPPGAAPLPSLRRRPARHPPLRSLLLSPPLPSHG
jgi:hypothetical protein